MVSHEIVERKLNFIGHVMSIPGERWVKWVALMGMAGGVTGER